MPEVNQYSFSLKEAAEALVKQAKLTEGRWQLVINFNFGAGNFGPDNASALPGAIVTIPFLGLTRADPNSPDGLVFDAALISKQVKPT